MTLTHAAFPTEMRLHMNSSVEPCHDFYEYACGNWIQTQEWSDNTTIEYVLATTKLQNENEKVISNIIQETPLVNELWDSCMAIDTINTVGNKPLEKDLQRISKAKTRHEVFQLVGEFARTGTNTILRFHVLPDRKAPKIYTLAASPARYLLPHVEYYSSEKFSMIETEYRAYIHKLLELSGYDSSLAAVDAIVAIDKDIARIHKAIELNVRQHVSIHDAISKWPILFAPSIKGLGIEIKPQRWFVQGQQVQVLSITAIERLERLVRSLSMDHLKLYVVFMLIHSRVLWLGDSFLNAYFKLFNQKILGQDVRRSRQRFCIERQVQYFPHLIGTYFYQKTFDQEKEQHVVSMIKLIQQAMNKHISHSEWIDYSTRKEAKKKLNKVLYLIGQSKISQHYPFTLSRNDYATNVHTILSHRFHTMIEKINKPVVREEWDISSAEVNAQYSPLENKIILPAAILQPPLFYHQKAHPARNFGGIGTLIGHELTHGFDNNGRKFDGDGNDYSFWSWITTNEFKLRSDRMVEQYSNFEVKGQDGVVLGKVHGRLTLAENIADNGGLSLAWDAYREYMTKFKPETNDVSAEEGEKMFFIAYGQSLCGKTRDETKTKKLLTDPHAPYEWRVNGAVMNNANFAKVFKCAVDAPMNPTIKRKIW